MQRHLPKSLTMFLPGLSIIFHLLLLMEEGIVSRDGESRTFIYRALFPLEKGEAYLFVVMDLIVELDGYRNFVGVLNSRQSLLDLDSPFEAVDDFPEILYPQWQLFHFAPHLVEHHCSQIFNGLFEYSDGI